MIILNCPGKAFEQRVGGPRQSSQSGRGGPAGIRGTLPAGSERDPAQRLGAKEHHCDERLQVNRHLRTKIRLWTFLFEYNEITVP